MYVKTTSIHDCNFLVEQPHVTWRIVVQQECVRFNDYLFQLLHMSVCDDQIICLCT